MTEEQIQQIYDTITSNDCRPMTFERFKQGIEEYRDGIIKEIDEIKKMLYSRTGVSVVEVQHILTELNSKILEMK